MIIQFYVREKTSGVLLDDGKGLIMLRQGPGVKRREVSYLDLNAKKRDMNFNCRPYRIFDTKRKRKTVSVFILRRSFVMDRFAYRSSSLCLLLLDPSSALKATESICRFHYFMLLAGLLFKLETRLAVQVHYR